jgi:hypothetical protein
MALDAERELTQWTAGTDVNRTLRMGTVGPRPGEERRKLYPGDCQPRRLRLCQVRVLGEQCDFVAVG